MRSATGDVVFFFQAEDGIRDIGVTGVQTCALPISTTLKAISNLLSAERGEVTKGSIIFDGEEVHARSPNELVRRGCIQVMEGRHCFAHLSVEENLFTGAFTRRDGSAAIRPDPDPRNSYF